MKALVLIITFSVLNSAYGISYKNVNCDIQVETSGKREFHQLKLTADAELLRKTLSIKGYNVWVGYNACRLKGDDKIRLGCKVLMGYTIRISKGDIYAHSVHRREWKHYNQALLEIGNDQVYVTCKRKGDS